MNTKKPLSQYPLLSYRHPTIYGWCMIGASDNQDAMNEAKRSMPKNQVSIEKLEISYYSHYIKTMLKKLIDEYLKEYPDSENPMSYFSEFGEEILIEKLKNRGDKRLVYIEPPLNQNDGGELVYG